MENKQYNIIKESAKYSNEINKTINYNELTENEFKLFFSMIHILNRNNINKAIKISFQDYKTLMNIDYKINNQKFYKLFNITFKKLHLINVKKTIQENNDIQELNISIMDYWTFNTKTKEITYKLNNSLIDLFNTETLQSNYSVLELKELNELKGIYTKKLYEYLNRYNYQPKLNTSNYIYSVIEIENFLKILNIPDSYKSYNLTSQIIKPTIKRLKESYYFTDLIYNIVKEHKKIKRIYFTWSKKEPKIYNNKVINNFFKEIDSKDNLQAFINIQERKYQREQRDINNQVIELKEIVESSNIKDSKQKEIIEIVENYNTDKSNKNYNRQNQLFALHQLHEQNKYINAYFYEIGKKINDKDILYLVFNLKYKAKRDIKTLKIKARDYYNNQYKQYESLAFTRATQIKTYNEVINRMNKLNYGIKKIIEL